MSEKIDIINAISMLLKANNVLILCHKNPDGDTIGSAGALYHALKGLQKNAAVLCHDEISSRYDYMQIELFENQFEPQFIVAVDVAGAQLFGESLIEYINKVDLCIDHHPSNSGYADMLLLDDKASATAEMLYDVIEKMGVEITELIASCLYTGVATDTGCFRFANTTQRTHGVAQKLIQHGANSVQLNKTLFENKSKRRILIERIALDSLEFLYDDRCAIINITLDQMEKVGVVQTDLEGITAIPRAIEGVDVGITIRQQTSSSYKVSVRSVQSVNAAQICAGLGGGGHAQAAGCEIVGSLESVRAAILAEVEKVI